MPKHTAPSDEILGKIWFLSYRYTWIFAAATFLSVFIQEFAVRLSLGIPVLVPLLALAVAEAIERTVGRGIKHMLNEFIRKSNNPIKDPRLLGLTDGWAACLTAIIIALVSSGLFGVSPPLEPGLYYYLTLLSGILCFGILIYGTITGKV